MKVDFQFTGEISYNGYKVNEFVPQKTSAYISQYDLHISEMTVRETLDFSARCQGIGDRAGRLCSASYGHNHALILLSWSYRTFFVEDIMKELCRREKQAGIIPESDIDTYMKVTYLQKNSLLLYHISKIVAAPSIFLFSHC